MKLIVKNIKHGSLEYNEAVVLRSKLLREPLGLKFTDEFLTKEKDDIHMGIYDEERLQLLGCLQLTPKEVDVFQIRQVAVEPDSQGLGLGRRLVEAAEEKAKNLGVKELILNARETAVPFYDRLGYQVYGESFVELTLLHRKMHKILK